MSDNPSNTADNTTGDTRYSDDYSRQGTPTSPLQGQAPSYPAQEARFVPPGYAPAQASPPPFIPGPPTGQSPASVGTYPPSTFPPQSAGHYRRRGGSIVGPVLLIGAGVIFLLNNIGVLPWSIWDQLWRLWPIVLIAVGLDLIVGRRNAALSVLLVLLLVAGGLALLAYNGGLQPLGGLATMNIAVPITSAKSADVTVDLDTGNLILDASADKESLASGTLEYYQGRSAPEQSLSNKSDQAELTLRQVGSGGLDLGGLFGGGKSPAWNVHLNPDIPMTFKADLGTGDSTIDLGSSHVGSLSVDSGTGNTTIVYPSNAGQVTSTVDGGVGNLNLRIPDGLETRVDLSTGVGNFNVDDRFTKQSDDVYITRGYESAKNKLDLKLDIGVGNVEISR